MISENTAPLSVVEKPAPAPQSEEQKPAAALPDAKAVAELLPESMSLDILRSAKIVPLRVEDETLIVGAVSFDAYVKAQMLGVALGLPIDLELHPDKDVSDLLHTLYDIRSVATDEAAKNM